MVPNAIVFYIWPEFPIISVISVRTEIIEMTGISDRISTTIALGTGIMFRKQFYDIKTQTFFRSKTHHPSH